jgi:S-adenosyl-L-methionine hydrolase (adenosine-forming)
MPIITLTSDWGNSDHFAAAVKGAILKRIPDARIVDVTHEIRHYDILQASFVIRETYPHFPEGTIHIVAIDSIESLKQPHVVVKANGHYFIGADNGLFSLILDNSPEKIIILQIPQDTGYFTFPERDRFAKAACHLADGKLMDELGEVAPALNTKLHMRAIVDKEMIKGRVMYVDAYENAYVNITEKEFREQVGNKPFTINFRRPDYLIHKIVKAYGDVNEIEMCALFSTSGFLQIAVNRGKASTLLGLVMDTPVNVIIHSAEEERD